MDPPDPLETRIAALRAEGRQTEAAALAEREGAPLRAAALLAEVWDYAGAVRLALSAGRPDEAYRLALGALDPRLVDSVVASLADHPSHAARAAELAASRGRTVDAARLWEHAGELERAAAAYDDAGELADAARLFESLGRLREAGVRYERASRLSPDDGSLAFGVGRVLAGTRRFEPALAPLQAAARAPETEGGALRLLVACFAALGLHHAAALALERLRVRDPALPPDVPGFLSESFGDERGLAVGATGGDDGDDDGGTRLAGRYLVLETLGGGATGRVVAARDLLLDVDVAVKVLSVGSSGAAGRDAYARFVREARIATAIDHPHVVRVFAFDPLGPYLVMERLLGGTLRDRLDAGRGSLPPVSPALARRTARGVLAALDAVHRRGVVHRDLKPANVLFDATGQPKLGDFGVAHLADLGATLTGAMLGSLAYMAPEQITGSQPPSAATDLYAFGVVLFELLTGSPPFRGPDLVTQHLRDTAPAPSAAWALRGLASLDPAFDRLVASLLAKDPSARPASAHDVLAAVEALPWDTLPERADVAESGAASAASSPAPAESPRFVELGSDAVEDRRLGRIVDRWPVADAEARAFYQRLAAADSPWLQAVYDLDDARVWVERLDGAALDGDLDRTQHAALAMALAGLHEVGVVHGHVDRDAVVVAADGRVVLRLPPGPAPSGYSAERDWVALDALLGAHLGPRSPRA